MYNFKNDTIIIWDTEFTSWDWSMNRWWSWPNEYRELVELWAIKIDTNSFYIIDSLHIYVKPKINPNLSTYFSDLTGIDQSVIEEKWIDFTEAMSQLENWAWWYELYSYWNDKNILVENCWLNWIQFPFKKFVFKDVRDVFDTFWINSSVFSSWTIHKAFWLNTSNHEHSAVWDSMNILNTLEFLYSKK